MIASTFQLAPGIGPALERRLWDAGVRTWDDLEGGGGGAVLGPAQRARVLEAVSAAREALAGGDAERLARMLPRRERWRLYPVFAEDAGFLDVECDGERLTAIGVLDRAGPRLFLRGRDLESFPDAVRGWKLLVTYNGHGADVPALQRAFDGWRPPLAHVDLRPLWARLGHAGGLKLLEEKLGLGRPPHLAPLAGADAVRLWRAHEGGEAGALRLLAEYNLYDAVNLKSLVILGYNRLVERLRMPAAPLAPWHRGDVLYDVTKALLELEP